MRVNYSFNSYRLRGMYCKLSSQEVCIGFMSFWTPSTEALLYILKQTSADNDHEGSKIVFSLPPHHSNSTREAVLSGS